MLFKHHIESGRLDRRLRQDLLALVVEQDQKRQMTGDNRHTAQQGRRLEAGGDQTAQRKRGRSMGLEDFVQDTCVLR